MWSWGLPGVRLTPGRVPSAGGLGSRYAWSSESATIQPRLRHVGGEGRREGGRRPGHGDPVGRGGERRGGRRVDAGNGGDPRPPEPRRANTVCRPAHSAAAGPTPPFTRTPAPRNRISARGYPRRPDQHPLPTI